MHLQNQDGRVVFIQQDDGDGQQDQLMMNHQAGWGHHRGHR